VAIFAVVVTPFSKIFLSGARSRQLLA